MSVLKHVLEIIDLLEDPSIDGNKVAGFFYSRGLDPYLEIFVEELVGEKGSTDFIKIIVRGRSKSDERVLGVIGRLGGLSIRPHAIGLVSDADGAIVALATAYKLAVMSSRGDTLPYDVIISTHICPRALKIPHKPAPMVTSPVDLYELVKREVDPRMKAILSIDATKANQVIKHYGFAITPTVKEGWILRVSPDLIDVYTRVTGNPPAIVPITMQDILPYTTRVYHLNSMMQPWIYTSAPVVGVATTTTTIVPGSATGANDAWVLEKATRFVVEVAKDYTRGNIKFYDEREWEEIIRVHGSLKDVMKRGLNN